MVAPLGSGRVYAVPSRSRPHKPYLTVVLDSGRWACSCPAIRSCRHIAQARKVHDRLTERHLKVARLLEQGDVG